jgi:hypothetical protein
MSTAVETAPAGDTFEFKMSGKWLVEQINKITSKLCVPM